MENFTPLSGLIGGLIIGLAATLLLWYNGRIAGISGIFNGMVTVRRKGDTLWRFLFILGLITGGFVHQKLIEASYQPLNAPYWVLIAGGIIVGFGTSMGSGCASGHGVCGLGRLSVRSLVAVLIFLSVGILTTFIIRHVLGGFQ
ncbi:MAG: YeeE/YedE thiosulfate transporter family protein [Thiobacillaceae bacterium]